MDVDIYVIYVMFLLLIMLLSMIQSAKTALCKTQTYKFNTILKPVSFRSSSYEDICFYYYHI